MDVSAKNSLVCIASFFYVIDAHIPYEDLVMHLMHDRNYNDSFIITIVFFFLIDDPLHITATHTSLSIFVSAYLSSFNMFEGVIIVCSTQV